MRSPAREHSSTSPGRRLGRSSGPAPCWFPASERVEVRAAEVIPSPEYVIPLPILEPGSDVLRREWVTYEDGDVPFMLSVSWHPPWVANAVPELLALLPPPTPMAATIIADRTGRDRDELQGYLWFDARQVKADGREGPLLRLPKTALVQAVTYTVAPVRMCWSTGSTSSSRTASANSTGHLDHRNQMVTTISPDMCARLYGRRAAGTGPRGR